MKDYLKLVHFEWSRFTKIYGTLILITIVMQLLGTFMKSKAYIREVNEQIYQGGVTKESFLNTIGFMSLEKLTISWWFVFPIFICITVLLIYVFFIWYRDWFGKSRFIYRLLMLPTARINIYLAKATTIFFMVLGLVALQIVLLLVENKILHFLVPDEFLDSMTIYEAITVSSAPLNMLMFTHLSDFLLFYGAGFLFVLLLFTAILLERSYQLLGVFYGIFYMLVTVGVFLAPVLLILLSRKLYLFPMELFYIEIIIGSLLIALSIFISHYLLNKKITV